MAGRASGTALTVQSCPAHQVQFFNIDGTRAVRAVNCDHVSGNQLLAELTSRGYHSNKIMENVDALRCDLYYSESLEMLPRSRIKRISVVEGNPELTATIVQNSVVEFQQELRQHRS